MASSEPDIADLKQRVEEIEALLVGVAATLGAVLQGPGSFEMLGIRQKYERDYATRIIQLAKGKGESQ